MCGFTCATANRALNAKHQPIITRTQQLAGTLDLQGRSQAVVDHHFDESRPGKPLWLIIPGGLVSLGAVAAAVYVLYLAAIKQTIDTTTAEYIWAGLAVVFVGATFAFSYGWELYDTGKAVKLTLTIVIVVVAVLVIAAALVILIPAALKGSTEGRRHERGRGLGPLFAALFASTRNRPPNQDQGIYIDTSPRYHGYDNRIYYGPQNEYPAGSYVPSPLQPPPGSFMPVPPATQPPPPWLATPATPSANQPAVAAPATPAGPAQLLPPVLCRTCQLSFNPVAGHPPICPNCGALYVPAVPAQ